jgi:DNA-binding response OmpR family regulator
MHTTARLGAARSPQSRARVLAPPATRVLLAEDDAEWRHAIASSLRAGGYEVVLVHDGGELLAQLGEACVEGRRHVAYDVVIADVYMPVCSGVQVLEGLRRAHWATPMILMSSFADRATRDRIESSGAMLFDKPFELEALHAALEALILARRGRSARALKRLLRDDPVFVVVASAGGVLEASSIARLLEREGIGTYLPHAANDSARDSGARKTHVYVREPDATRARAILLLASARSS